MTKAGLEKSAEARIEYWRARIAEQERSGMSVGRFCQEQQITEQSFYVWRKQLRQPEAVRFALVERGAAPAAIAGEPMLELVLKTGAPHRIGRLAGMIHLPGSVWATRFAATGSAGTETQPKHHLEGFHRLPPGRTGRYRLLHR